MKSVFERARAYVGKMPEAVSGAGGHDATFAVAVALVKGFSLPVSEAAQLLAEYNARCVPPWREGELAHKLRQAQHAQRADGYLLGERAWRAAERAAVAAAPRPERVRYDEGALRRLAGDLRVDGVWLANRSQLDPSQVSSEVFLRAMFRPGERVIVFADDRSQGVVWPDEGLPVAGARGVWFLAQPVDGEMRMNPRTGKVSRRSEESVTCWRYALLESDEAPVGLWLSALVQMRLPIAAVYSSGGRSVHALVKVDAGTKAEWDARVRPLKAWMPAAGADDRAMTAVRLSRLPGQPRAEKNGWQKLLYVNSYPLAECLTNMPVLRDVESHWVAASKGAYAAGDIEGMRVALTGLEFYSRVRPPLVAWANDLRAAVEEFQEVIL